MNLSLINKYFQPYRVLDVGANIGQFHKEFHQYSPNSFIFSIEASNECEPYLKQITENYYIGLLAKNTSNYNFYSRKDTEIGTGNSIYREMTSFYSNDNLKIHKKTGVKLDDVFESGSVFDLIKIDTQGSELDIIQGGEILCEKAKGILLEVSLTQYNEKSPLYNEVINFMKIRGFFGKEILDETRNHGSYQQDILFIKEKNIK